MENVDRLCMCIDMCTDVGGLQVDSLRLRWDMSGSSRCSCARAIRVAKALQSHMDHRPFEAHVGHRLNKAPTGCAGMPVDECTDMCADVTCVQTCGQTCP